MKRRKKIADQKSTLAVALTWDGARWPIKKLPPKARAFLVGRSKSLPVPTSRELSRLFTANKIEEMRICWVPCLKGGKETLTEPFAAPAGKRIGFVAAKTVSLGPILGVIYRKGA